MAYIAEIIEINLVHYPQAVTNKERFIDLLETYPYFGKTLIPLNGAPIKLVIKGDSYPVADKDGLIT